MVSARGNRHVHDDQVQTAVMYGHCKRCVSYHQISSSPGTDPHAALVDHAAGIKQIAGHCGRYTWQRRALRGTSRTVGTPKSRSCRSGSASYWERGVVSLALSCRPTTCKVRCRASSVGRRGAYMRSTSVSIPYRLLDVAGDGRFSIVVQYLPYFRLARKGVFQHDKVCGCL